MIETQRKYQECCICGEKIGSLGYFIPPDMWYCKNCYKIDKKGWVKFKREKEDKL